jgi:hypothetical protein
VIYKSISRDGRELARKRYGSGGGLYANIYAKQERIKHGSGEKMRKPGAPGAPTAKAFEQAAKTRLDKKRRKRQDGGTRFDSTQRGISMATAIDIFRGVAIFVLVPLTFALMIITYRLYRAYRTDRRSEYAKNRARSPSLSAVARGAAPSFYDGVRDERVAAGIAVNTKTNEWVEQGRLSEEAISSVLR